MVLLPALQSLKRAAMAENAYLGRAATRDLTRENKSTRVGSTMCFREMASLIRRWTSRRPFSTSSAPPQHMLKHAEFVGALDCGTTSVFMHLVLQVALLSLILVLHGLSYSINMQRLSPCTNSNFHNIILTQGSLFLSYDGDDDLTNS